MTVRCRNCGQEWPRDPALEVPCPNCRADVGKRCRRPSGHPCAIHAGREQKAFEVVDGYGRCPATAPPAPAEPTGRQSTLTGGEAQ